VREWIVLLDDLARLGGWGRVLRDCWGLVKVPNCAAFSLLTAGENDRHWGPMFRDLAREDPPTHEFVPDYERSESRFKRGCQVAPRVSTWAIEFIVSYLHLSRCVQLERAISRPMLDRARSRSPGLVVASQIGHTELLEFEDGLIHAVPDGPTSYRLRCYAPYLGVTSADYNRAAREFAGRTDEILGVARL
jgi:hypothetical protein